MLWDSGVSTFSWQPWSQFHPFCASFPLLKRNIFISPTLFTLRYGTVPWIAPLWVIITTVQQYNGCFKSNLNASNEILGESSESRFNVRNYSIVEAWLPVFGSHQLKLVSEDITEKDWGSELQTQTLGCRKEGIFLSGFTWERIFFTRKHTPQVWSLLVYPLHTVHAPIWKAHKQKKTKAWNFPRMLPGLVLPPDCTHIPVFTASSFSFSLRFTFSNSDLNLRRCLSIPLTSEKHHTRPSSSTCSASLNLLRLRPPRNKAIQSSSTIFSHIYSFSLRFVKRLRQFYTVFPSGSAPFSVLIVFQRRLYVLKTLNTITAPAILKN